MNEDQKQEKGIRRKLKSFFPKSGENKQKKKKKKKVFAAIVGSFGPDWLFFLWSSSAQLSMGGRLNLDWGTLNLDRGTQTTI